MKTWYPQLAWTTSRKWFPQLRVWCAFLFTGHPRETGSGTIAKRPFAIYIYIIYIYLLYAGIWGFYSCSHYYNLLSFSTQQVPSTFVTVWLRAAQVLRDWLGPINNGTVTMHQVLDVNVPVQNGQCLLDDLSLQQFVRTNWWVEFLNFLNEVVLNEAGSSDADKLIVSNIVGRPEVCGLELTWYQNYMHQ